MEEQTSPQLPVYSRRGLLALGGAAAAATLAAACSSDSTNGSTTVSVGATTPPVPTTVPVVTQPIVTDTVVVVTTPAAHSGAAQFGGGGGDGIVKIGLVAPTTGPLAGFGAAVPYVVDAVTKLAEGGLVLGDKSYRVQIVVKDAESRGDVAALRAGELILADAVDVMLVIGSPELVNPVADQCEANAVPCFSTLAPWQSYLAGRGGNPATVFDWTYHCFWGIDQLIAVFVDMWSTVDSNKTIGMLCPDDLDGNALASLDTGLTAAARGTGYSVVEPGRFTVGSKDFTDIAGQFAAVPADIVTGIATPADFAAFSTEADSQRLAPKLITMARALSYPAAVEAFGDRGDGLACEIGWAPTHPYVSSLTGEKAQDLADTYEASTGKQWTQYLGFVHALFEICFDALARAAGTDKQAIATAAAATKLDTVVGPVRFGAPGTPKNVAPTPLVGGQWQQTTGGTFPFDLVVTNNALAPEIPVNGALSPLR